jgi:hypothetical protein
MAELLNVKAAPGLSVPMEDKPRIYVTDSVTVQVPDTAYYQRRLADGDLIEEAVAAAEVLAATPTIVKSGAK